MSSAHYEFVAASLEKNIELLRSDSGAANLGNMPLLSISEALVALSDALQDEFVAINTRLNHVEQLVGRPGNTLT